MLIKTGSWFTKLPPDHIKVGISRGVPRGTPASYRRYGALNPGPWFKSSTIPDYLVLYGALLARLRPEKVAADLLELAPGKVPVMVCFESPTAIAEGKAWCHRHLVAKWLDDRLGISVEEVDHPTLDRWAKLRAVGMEPPTFR